MLDSPPELAYLALRHGQPAVSADAPENFGGIRVPEQYRDVLLAAARRHEVPPAYLAWLLSKESSFNPRAIGSQTSSGRAMGIAQFMPGTARARGVDPLDPYSAIPGAAAYLAELARKHGGWEQGLARYGTFSTGQGAAADAKVRQQFREFARTGRFPETPSPTGNLDAGMQRGQGVPGEARVPYYPSPEDQVDPAEALWKAYSQDDNLTRILGGGLG